MIRLRPHGVRKDEKAALAVTLASDNTDGNATHEPVCKEDPIGDQFERVEASEVLGWEKPRPIDSAIEFDAQTAKVGRTHLRGSQRLADLGR